MGTSKDYEAPRGQQWGPFKGLVTRLARETPPNEDSANRAIREFIGVNGGVERIARQGGTLGQSKAAQKIAQSLAQFMSSVGTFGFQVTAREVGLDLEGKTLAEIVLLLLDYLGGPYSAIDEVDARNALFLLLSELLGNVTPEEVGGILEQQARGTALADFLVKFFGYCIYEQFRRVFYDRLVARIGNATTDAFLTEVRNFITRCIGLETLGLDVTHVDWAGEEGRLMADRILQLTLEVFLREDDAGERGGQTA